MGTGFPRSNLPFRGPITADPTNAIVPAVTCTTPLPAKSYVKRTVEIILFIKFKNNLLKVLFSLTASFKNSKNLHFPGSSPLSNGIFFLTVMDNEIKTIYERCKGYQFPIYIK